jgi:hypothetical protein
VIVTNDLDVLVASPPDSGFGGSLDRAGFHPRFKIPNPIAFALHKLIVSKQRRDRRKREKDVLYAFDTLVLFAERQQELADCQAAVTKALTRATVRSLRELSRSLQIPNDTVRGAAQIAAAGSRPIAPLPEQIAATLGAALARYGL